MLDSHPVPRRLFLDASRANDGRPNRKFSPDLLSCRARLSLPKGRSLRRVPLVLMGKFAAQDVRQSQRCVSLFERHRSRPFESTQGRQQSSLYHATLPRRDRFDQLTRHSSEFVPWTVAGTSLGEPEDVIQDLQQRPAR